MTITNILLGIIAISEITRLILTHKKTSKKEHFKSKLEGTQKMVWDLEFKKFKTAEIREDVRKEYDYMQSRIDTINKSIQDFPKNKDKAERARLEDDKVRAERDLGRLKGQIEHLDLDIKGSKPTNQYPDGVSGIEDQINSISELTKMLKNWIKKL